MKKTMRYALLPLAVLSLAACTASPPGADYEKITAEVVKASFQDRGIAKVDRLNPDEANRLCSAADVAGKPLDEKKTQAIEAANLKSVKWPTDGKFLGDWKLGEQIAQSGRGMTWSDTATTVNGGNC
jgi:L-cysteine S-thiosulfotransferase